MKAICLALCLAPLALFAQTNISIINPEAEAIIHGNYNPNDYQVDPVVQADFAVNKIQNEVNPDSLKALIIELAGFDTRHTSSDTVSTVRGFGAARRWVYDKFEAYGLQNNNRLIPGYVQFDQEICGVTQHRNIIGVLPGADTSNHEVIVIEGHMDSRCDGVCDTTCTAEGVEDNASGTALVMELARVMSQMTFNNTIVFMVTTGEEQGLFGAAAMARYCFDENIPVKAVLNNDVIGGVTCGETSSPPSCPGLNDIDSTQVRLFSQGGFNSRNKQLARFIKLQYQEMLEPIVSVPMLLTIMTAEDRTGRGGDHIPFRQRGFAAMRFTSANEHGDASNGPGYEDRQHTSEDILGVDTNNDQIIDSFFVDFNYLSRNARINGTAASVLALGPQPCDFEMEGIGTSTNPGIRVKILGYDPAFTYRVAVRDTPVDWDTVFTISDSIAELYPPVLNTFIVSVATQDENGLESLFSAEQFVHTSELITEGLINEDKSSAFGAELLQNRPNPFDESTFIGVLAKKKLAGQKGSITIKDVQGKIVEVFELELSEGLNEVHYRHGYGQVGTYYYTLEVAGKIIDTKAMVFAN